MGKNTELLAGQQIHTHARDRLRAGRERISWSATWSLSKIVANSTYWLTIMMNWDSKIVLELDDTQEIFDLSEQEKELIKADIKAGKQFWKPPESFGIAIIDDWIPFSESEPQCVEDPVNPGSYVYNYDGALKLGEELAKIFPGGNIRIRLPDEQVQHMKDNSDKYTNNRFRNNIGEFDDDCLCQTWTAKFADAGIAWHAYLDIETGSRAWWQFISRDFGFPVYPTHG